jgi:hypothetical protein
VSTINGRGVDIQGASRAVFMAALDVDCAEHAAIPGTPCWLLCGDHGGFRLALCGPRVRDARTRQGTL